jgi:isochorismate synthase
MTIFEKIQICLENNQPFVAYNKPNSDDLIAFFQKNDSLDTIKDFTEKGFVFASFDNERQLVFLIENCEIVTEKWHFLFDESDSKIEFSSDDVNKNQHINLIEKGINEILKGEIDKIVLSRKETLFVDKIDVLKSFIKLLNANRPAFSYLWFHPKVGLWMGAFAEQLIFVDGRKFNTMALAGTQKFQGFDEVTWQEKEKIEQEIVTNFIVENIKNQVDDLKISQPYTIKAANVLHLKSDISGFMKENISSKNLIEVLHPTPAVCGNPKQLSKDFILKNENYDREFYSGFLGELNFNTNQTTPKTDLFVNLRCLKINENQVSIFVGGGITGNSNPNLEWDETVNKTVAMKKIIL